MSVFTDWFARNFTTHAATSASKPVAPSTVDPDAVERIAWAKLADLREGDRLVVYPDSRGKPTVARGHLVLPEDGLKLGDRITQQRSDAFWLKDGADAFSHAISLSEQAGIKDISFLPYLASVCYQLGDEWTRTFKNTWKMICDGEYADAADALDGTKWDNQTPVRVSDFQGALRRLPAKQ